VRRVIEGIMEHDDGGKEGEENREERGENWFPCMNFMLRGSSVMWERLGKSYFSILGSP